MGYSSRAIRADIEKGSRYFRRSDNTPFGRDAAAEVSMTADKRWHGFHLSTIREKLHYDSSRANNVRPYHVNLKYSMQPKEKIKALSAFSFAYAGAKEKAIKKKSADMRFRALRSTTRALPIDLQAFDKA